MISFSQEETKSYTPYFAAGLSMTNTDDFNAGNYPSIEVGLMYSEITVAAVFGRNNLTNMFDNQESFNNYWYEGKISYSKPLSDNINGYGLFGIGTYIDGSSMFIEYGLGISSDLTDNIGTFIQVSNWDNVNYITPGFFISF